MTKIIKSTFKYSTDRLIFRFLKRSDYKEWKRSHSDVLSKQNIWDFGPIPLNDEKKLQKHFEKLLYNHGKSLKEEKGYFFSVFLKEGGYFIGVANLMDISREIFQNAYIGYRILNNYWSQGYGSEVVEALIDIGFNYAELHRLEAGIEPNNIRSIRLIKKMGFRKEGRSCNRLFVRDEWRDMMIYALTKEDLKR